MAKSKKETIPKLSSGMEIPDYAIERMARCMLPMIQQFYESEEGKQELKEWEAQKQVERMTDK
ncbi:MAG: hypothetical protein ACOX85_09615 [Candidatus Pararuminococcus gallinarum]|jgi:hypothetical protein